MKEILIKFKNESDFNLFLEILTDVKEVELDSENNIAIVNNLKNADNNDT